MEKSLTRLVNGSKAIMVSSAPPIPAVLFNIFIVVSPCLIVPVAAVDERKCVSFTDSDFYCLASAIFFVTF